MAEQKIRNAYKNFMFKFSPFLNANKNVGSIELMDDKSVEDFSPKRFNFYGQVMESIVNSNPEIVKKVFNTVNLFKYKHDKMEKEIRDIKNRITNENKGKIADMLNVYLPEDRKLKVDDDSSVPSGNRSLNAQERVENLSRVLGEKEEVGKDASVDPTKLSETPGKQSSSVAPPMTPPVPPPTIAKDAIKVRYAQLLKIIIDGSLYTLSSLAINSTKKKIIQSNPTNNDIINDCMRIIYNNIAKIKKYSLFINSYYKTIISRGEKLDTLISVFNGEIYKEYVYNTNFDEFNEATLDYVKTVDLTTIIGVLKDALSNVITEISSSHLGARNRMDLVRATNGRFNDDKDEYLNTHTKLLNQTKGGAPNPQQQAKQQAINSYFDDLELSPNIDKVNLRDRGIFIVLTFIIRAIALFITEWAIYSGFINSFSQSFNMYFGVYLCIFVLILILTNSKNEDITFFNQLFFYINAESEDGKGVIRILLQILCIFFILPIPYMVKDFRMKDKTPNRVLTYTDKSNIYYSVDKFTLFTWILTSIVALSV